MELTICLADVTYAYTNRTFDLKLSRQGFEWIKAQVASRSSPQILIHRPSTDLGRLELGRLRISQAELQFLQSACPYLPKTYLAYLEKFSFKPDDQLVLAFAPDVGVSDRMANEGNESSGKVEFVRDVSTLLFRG